MKQVIIITLVFTFFTCKTPKVETHGIQNNNECKEYYNFLKANWIQVDSFYQFKGNPEYWLNYPQYGRFDCLINFSRSELEFLLGEPTKKFVLPKTESWIYCMNKKCTVELIHYKNAKEWVFIFNREGKLKSIYFNPTF